MGASPLTAQRTARKTATNTSKTPVVDNSFLVEEAFNQESGIFQNIFTWTRANARDWAAAFTQEWPLFGQAHQFSYTVPFSTTDTVKGINDVFLNYRYQLTTEAPGRPAISPRLSLILPTGRAADGLGNGVTGLQVTVPMSKQFGKLYLHVNAGWTWLPGVSEDTAGSMPVNLTSPQVAGSGIWRVTPMFNLMLETVAIFAESLDTGVAVTTRSVTVSPGFRGGWNFSDRQLVLGVAAPVTRSAGTSRVSLLTYFSYELPFLRSH